jgi:hypothetical protein
MRGRTKQSQSARKPTATDMAYTNGLVTITTSPTEITVVQQLPQGPMITNTGAQTVFLGGPSAAASGANQGVPVAAGASVQVPASASEDNTLFGIVAMGTSTVAFLNRFDPMNLAVRRAAAWVGSLATCAAPPTRQKIIAKAVVLQHNSVVELKYEKRPAHQDPVLRMRELRQVRPGRDRDQGTPRRAQRGPGVVLAEGASVLPGRHRARQRGQGIRQGRRALIGVLIRQNSEPM